MKHDFFDHHSHGSSPIHSLDARVKIAIFILFSCYAILVRDLLSIRTLIVGCALVVLLLLTRVSPGHIAAKYLRLIWIVILMTFLLPFQGSDRVLFNFYGLKIYQKGLMLQLTICTRSTILLLAMILVNLSTPFTISLNALRWYRAPVIFVNLLAYVYRFLFIFIDELERLFICWESRYSRLRLGKRFYYLSNLIGALFVRAFERSEHIYMAMKARGYSGRVFVSIPQRLRVSDLLFLATICLFFIALGYL
jgi:cobalt/nickel transport system permease protein